MTNPRAARTTLLLGCAILLLPAAGAAENAAASDWTPPLLRSGHPDLNGVWDFRTLTPFERPSELEGKDFFTDEEAATFEADRLAEFADRDNQEPADIVGNYNQFWFDPGDVVGVTNRTSLVVDPPDGRVPPLTADAATLQAAQREARLGVDRHSPTPGGFVEQRHKLQSATG